MVEKVTILLTPSIPKVRMQFHLLFGAILADYDEDEADDLEDWIILDYQLRKTCAYPPAGVQAELKYDGRVAEFTNGTWTVLVSAQVPSSIVGAALLPSAMMITGPDVAPGNMGLPEDISLRIHREARFFLSSGNEPKA